jgi:hypothetical protein
VLPEEPCARLYSRRRRTPSFSSGPDETWPLLGQRRNPRLTLDTDDNAGVYDLQVAVKVLEALKLS